MIYRTTIGLEIHVELKTATKMFCGCEVAFGGEPNTRVCPICLGHPGTLPVTNAAAVEFAAMIGLALDCKINERSIFHRKNYFYPDMPKNYQISQYDEPLATGGSLEIEVDGQARKVGITRVHLEEDTGKSLHVGLGGRIHEAEHSLEDYNRAGVPLVEIVTEPDMSSPEQAKRFAQELRQILAYLGVSDVRMEEGSLRFDANISMAPEGQRGVKTEVKNMNSLKSLFRALSYEELRQRELLQAGSALEQGTRHWDEKAGVTKALRTKEEAFDYRYFPEPDLPPLVCTQEWVSSVRSRMPELPAARRRRLTEALGLAPAEVSAITATPATADFFEQASAAAKVAEPPLAANWLAHILAGIVSERGEEVPGSNVTPPAFAELLDLVAGGEITAAQGKEVLAGMVETGRPPRDIVEERGIRQESDRDALMAAVLEVIEANQEVADRIRSGDDKPFGFLVGQIMKHTGGGANPKIVTQLIREQLF